MFNELIYVCGDCQIPYTTMPYEACPNCLCDAFAEYRITGKTSYDNNDKYEERNSLITLYEKKREASVSMFEPATNERLVWLIDFISKIEEDKDASKTRIDALFNGQMINTDLHSFILRVKNFE